MVLPEILQSKKFLAALIAVGIKVWADSRGMPLEESAALMAPFLVYIPSQGVADSQKEAEKIRVRAPSLEAAIARAREEQRHTASDLVHAKKKLAEARDEIEALRTAEPPTFTITAERPPAEPESSFPS